jgi:heptosyltransferase II
LTKVARRLKTRGVTHQADYYRQLVTGLDIACDQDVAPRIAPRPSSREKADALLESQGVSADAVIIGFAPGAAYGEAKQWFPERMAEVTARIVRQYDATCVLLGAAHDRDAARAIESWLRASAPDTLSRVVNLTGRTSLHTLVGVIDRTRAFVANDSGAMHLAAALGKPVTAVFGPTDERATRPIGDHHVLTASVFCRPCMLRDCPIDHRCMKRISVDTVYDAVSASLSGQVNR